MTTWSQQSKNPTTFGNQAKNTTTSSYTAKILIDDSILLLETGDEALLETGDSFLLESSTQVNTPFNYQTKN